MILVFATGLGGQADGSPKADAMIPTLYAWIDTRPYLFVVGLPVAGVLMLMARGASGGRVRWGLAGLIGFGVYSIAFLIVFAGPFIGVERPMTFPMTWRIDGPEFSGKTQANVRLDFRDHPGHFVGIYSDELARHLEGTGSKTIDVTFLVTTDCGQTRGFHEVRIGTLTRWASDGGYAGEVANAGPSPFP